MPNYYDKQKCRYRFTFKRTINGKLIRFSKLLPEAWGQSEADAYDRKESARIYAIESGIEKPKREIVEAISLYLDFHLPGKKTSRKIILDLSYLAPYIEGKYLDELGDIAKRYTKDHAHLKPGTIHNRLALLKAAVRYAYKHHDIGDRDYTDKMIMPTVNNKRHVYIQSGDLDRLLIECDDEQTKAIMLLAFYTGLRWRAEILKLTPEQIIISNDQAWISILDTKSGQPHMIPVHPDAIDALRHIPFSYTDTYYYKRFWKARKAAGLDHVRWHDERHSFASALISSGSSLAEVGRALNHSDPQSTSRYSHLYPERVLDMVLRLPRTRKDPP